MAIVATLMVLAFGTLGGVAAQSAELDFDYFKNNVQPIFL